MSKAQNIAATPHRWTLMAVGRSMPAVKQQERYMAWHDFFRSKKPLFERISQAFKLASEANAQFRGSGSLPHLVDAAKHLCDGLSALAADDDFWKALDEHANEPSKRSVFTDLTAFLEKDRDPIKRALGNNDKDVDALILDVSALLEQAQRTGKLTPERLGALRKALREFSADVCAAAKLPADASRRTALMRLVKKGVVVAAGAVVIVGDGIAATQGVPADLCSYSAELGVGIILSQFPGLN